MDKVGFDLMDQEYQRVMKAEKERINDKWKAFYENKKYVGSKEQQEKARLTDEKQRADKIMKDTKAYSEKIEPMLFGGKFRNDLLSEAKENEKNEEMKRKLENIRKNNQNRDRGRGR